MYIEYQESREPELYNIVKDPRQLDNLMGKPEAKTLSKKMKTMLEQLKKGKQG